MLIEIKHRYDNSVVLFSHDAEVNSVKITLLLALKLSANIQWANLRRADLRGADLRGAKIRNADLDFSDLRGAYLQGADLGFSDTRGADFRGTDLRGATLGNKKLIGERPFFQIGPIGSRNEYLQVLISANGVQLNAGCFYGSIDQFERLLDAKHGLNNHGEEYRAALVLIRKHMELWTPKIEEVKDA